MQNDLEPIRIKFFIEEMAIPIKIHLHLLGRRCIKAGKEFFYEIRSSPLYVRLDPPHRHGEEATRLS